MVTPKVEEPKEVEPPTPVEEPKEGTSTPVEKTKKEESEKQLVLPKYDGSRVRYIMKDNRSDATRYHCKMEDGTTKHVPRELFNEA